MNDLNLEGLSDKQLRIFAVRCARRVQHLMTDPRSIAALDVAERHANGQATDEELKVAREAAYVAWDAALNVELFPIRGANFATRAATSAVALVTASDAAWVTASDAASAAGSVAAGEIDEHSSWVTLQLWYTARDRERVKQQKILDEIRQEQPRLSRSAMSRDDIIRMARESGWTEYSLLHAVEVQRLETFAALVAAAEQKPISDVTEAVTKTVIETEKLLCEKIGRQWQPSGMSIRTLVDELATLVAEREREACAAIAEKELGNTAMLTSMPPKSSAAWNILFAIRARGET